MHWTSLNTLTDEELLQWFENERDPLTTTEMETELAQRFAKLVDESIRGVLEEFSIESDTSLRNELERLSQYDGVGEHSFFSSFSDKPEAMDHLIRKLNEFEVATIDELGAKLELAHKFAQILSESEGYLSAYLNNLIATVKE